MKKICFFIASISKAGGTERVCTAIANKLAQLGYEVTIISFYGSAPFFELQENIRFVYLFQKKYNFKLFLPLVILKLRKKIKEINPSILINVDSALFIYTFLSTLRLNQKNIVWEHFSYNESLGAKVRVLSRKLSVKYADAIVTLTNKDKSNWEQNLICKAPVFTINNPSPFYNLTIEDNANRKNIVLSVGRLTYQKGFDRLLEAWKIVNNSNITSGWELHIVGSGELKNEIEKEITSLNLSNSVKLFPVTSNIQEHYQQASIFCLSSRFEGFPMVLLEAQSFELPIVSFDCETGPSEIISNFKNGILVKNGDIAELSERLLYLIKNENIRLEMGKSASKNSFNYSIDVIIKSWIHLFNSLK